MKWGLVLRGFTVCVGFVSFQTPPPSVWDFAFFPPASLWTNAFRRWILGELLHVAVIAYHDPNDRFSGDRSPIYTRIRGATASRGICTSASSETDVTPV